MEVLNPRRQNPEVSNPRYLFRITRAFHPDRINIATANPPPHSTLKVASTVVIALNATSSAHAFINSYIRSP